MKKMKNILIFLSVLAVGISVAVWGISHMGDKGKDPDSPTIQTETETEMLTEKETEYISAEEYRESKVDEKVIPNAIEVSDGKGHVYFVYEYDDQSRNMVVGEYGEIGKYPSQICFIGNDGVERIMEKHSYQYNDDGMVIAEECYADEDLYDDKDSFVPVSGTEFTYYEGKMAKEIDYIYDYQGVKKPSNTYEFYYDGNGFLSRMDVLDGNGLLSYYEEVTCNTNGSPAVIRQYTFDGILMGIKEYGYRDDGNVLTYQEYSGEKENLIVETEYLYDDKDYLRKAVMTDYEQQEDGAVKETTTHYLVRYSEGNEEKLGKFSE